MGDTIEFVEGGTRVRVENLNRVVRALNKAADDATDMKDLMHSLGETVIKAADVPTRSGSLAASLRAGNGKTKAVVRAGGAKVPYAPIIEYGNPRRNVPAQPYLVPALERERDAVYAQLEAGINALLEKNGLE